jgi:hypothetical protein
MIVFSASTGAVTATGRLDEPWNGTSLDTRNKPISMTQAGWLQKEPTTPLPFFFYPLFLYINSQSIVLARHGGGRHQHAHFDKLSWVPGLANNLPA